MGLELQERPELSAAIPRLNEPENVERLVAELKAQFDSLGAGPSGPHRPVADGGGPRNGVFGHSVLSRSSRKADTPDRRDGATDAPLPVVERERINFVETGKASSP